MKNIIIATDSYKCSHHVQYPPGTEIVHSYMESRGGRFDNTVMFGLQYYLRNYLEGCRVKMDDVNHAELFVNAHMGPGHFNRPMWERIATVHAGRLPVHIRALREGTVIPTGNALFTIENTDPLCFPLTNHLETLLLKIWYPITVATQSREIKKLIKRNLEETGDPAGIDFKLHDFGYRGVSSEESAAIGAAAHLVNFKGTDTLAGILLLQQNYQTGMHGFSIPAAEHSTITSWGQDGETEAYANMLTRYPNGLVAVVSDSFDIYAACSDIWGGTLKERVLARDGCLVVRPDSGEPKDVVLEVVKRLADKFGAEENGKGFKVLNPKVRVIQGDGINLFSIGEILDNLKRNGWSGDNVAFGMGGALLQMVNRDTQKFAIKCSWAQVAGKGRDVMKKPVTDTGKRSKAGRLTVVFREGGAFETVRDRGFVAADDAMQTVFLNGELKNETNFDSVRRLAAV